MTAQDTQILIYRLKDHHPGTHAPNGCMLKNFGSRVDLHDDVVELTEACEKLQMAENILQRLINNQPWRGIFVSGGTVWLDEGGVRPSLAELKYLESLVEKGN
jgi:hypothetical protein